MVASTALKTWSQPVVVNRPDQTHVYALVFNATVVLESVEVRVVPSLRILHVYNHGPK